MNEELPPSREELLTEQFNRWERRGRGWMVWPHPVELEPPFRPFLFHHVERTVIDDGRRATFLSSIKDKLLGKARGGNIPAPIEEQPEPDAHPTDHERDIVEVSFTL